MFRIHSDIKQQVVNSGRNCGEKDPPNKIKLSDVEYKSKDDNSDVKK